MANAADSNVAINESNLRQGAQLLADDVRAHMGTITGNPVRGRKGLSSYTLSNIFDRAHSVAVSNDNQTLTGDFNMRSAADALKKIITNFEEYCRRKNIDIADHLKVPLAQLFLEELSLNAQEFDCADQPEKMISLTFYQGISCLGLNEEGEFESLRGTPGIFKHAAVNNPKYPREFLRKVIKTIDGLNEDPEFEKLRDTPGIFKYAAVNNPKDPREFLRKVIKTIDELKEDSEFESLRGTPGIFKHAAVHSPKDPQAWLRKVMSGEVTMPQWSNAATGIEPPSPPSQG